MKILSDSKRSNIFYSCGLTLIELLLVLSIVAVILIMVTRYFGVAERGAHITQGISQIREVIKASSQWLSGQPSFQGAEGGEPVSIALLKKEGFLSAGFVETNPWGGSLTITPQKTNTQTAKIQMTGLQSYDCYQLESKTKTLSALAAGAGVGCSSGKKGKGKGKGGAKKYTYFLIIGG